MPNFCSACGAQVNSDSRFCSECGAPLGMDQAASSPDPMAPASPAEQPSPPIEADSIIPIADTNDPVDRGPRFGVHIILGIIALVVISGTAFLAWRAFFGGQAYSGTDATNQAEASSNTIGGLRPEGERVTLYVATEANVRDRPTASGSNIVSKLARGEQVSGTIVTGVDGTSQWLKLDGSDQFIGMINLDPAARVPLKSMDGSDLITAGQCVFVISPTDGAPVKLSLVAGQPIKRIGVTQNGYAEFGLPKGGVGYIVAGGAACKTVPSKVAGAISNNLIQLNPETCEFGPELEPYFDQAIAKREAQGGIQNEGDQISIPVNKVFRGLKVNSVFTGYEWLGVYFDAPVNQVRQVFRDMGINVDKDGNIASQELAVGIYATEEDARKNGQSYLTCGV